MQKFLIDNTVLIFGLLAAIGMTVQQYTSAGPVDYLVLALAVLVGTIGFLAKSLRGQWPTILGSILPSLGAILTTAQAHQHISLTQFFGSVAIALGGVFAPPAKSLAYEQSPQITAAKQQAAATDALQLKTPPVSK